MHFDVISLAAAIRDAGIAEDEAALELAADLMLQFRTPTPEMVASDAIDRAASQSGLGGCFRKFRLEP